MPKNTREFGNDYSVNIKTMEIKKKEYVDEFLVQRMCICTMKTENSELTFGNKYKENKSEVIVPLYFSVGFIILKGITTFF